MNKEALAHIYNGLLLKHKKEHSCVSSKWMNLKPIIQSEVSHKEKDKYHIPMLMYGIQKDGTDEFICRAAMEKTQRTNLWTQQGEEGVGEMYEESNMETSTTICKIDSMGICYMIQETQTGSLYQPRGVGWGGKCEGTSRGRGHMYTYG